MRNSCIVAASSILLLLLLCTSSARAASVNSNPWNYSFTASGGTVITNPPDPTFCQYFRCIPYFWSGKGYVVECQDAMFSKSGGIRGACSGKHHGVLRTLYAHTSLVGNPPQPIIPSSSGNTAAPPTLPYTGSAP